MSDFEQKYYEAPTFWADGALTDESNSKRVQFTVDMIPEEVTSLCDIGCGNGVFGNYLMQVKPDLTILSIDRSEMALSFVNTDKMVGSIENIPLNNHSYDCVTSLQVLEHIPVNIYKTALSELARVSSRYILISVPLNEDLRKNTTECPQCLSVFNADLHLRSYTNSDIDSLFSEYGFRNVSVKNIFPIQTYAGVEAYYKARNFFAPGKKGFHSPICPVCGYENEQFAYIPHAGMNNSRSPGILTSALNTVKKLIKVAWPKKELPGYWVIALYQRDKDLQ